MTSTELPASDAATPALGPATPAARLRGALLFAGGAAIGVAFAWGFSVDDALISARVAHHLATGVGYRFNPGGPAVDAVTPLGWAALLAPLAHAGAWQAATRASVAGAVAWVLAAGWLGRSCAEACRGWRLAALALVLATCLPLGAWAVAGMETAFVMVLGVAALAPSRWGAACAGLAAAWRPELLPWALALAVGQSIARRAPPAERALAVALALGPALATALARQALFGHPAPLAVFAKPSDAEHGLRYALGAALLSGPPYLLLAARAWRTLPRAQRAITAALAVHLVALAGVGGDWMPFWRLAMPAFPGLLLVSSSLLAATSTPHALLRLLPPLACAALLHTARGPDTRAVRAERSLLIAALPPLLADSRRVATLDVGWVGASGDYSVIDLAGVTDPDVARLPGGHTSKRLPPPFLDNRHVDALVLLADASAAPHAPLRCARQVESRALTLHGAESFRAVGRIPLNARQEYVVLRRPVDVESEPTGR
jgi:hypothetical protein